MYCRVHMLYCRVRVLSVLQGRYFFLSCSSLLLSFLFLLFPFASLSPLSCRSHFPPSAVSFLHFLRDPNASWVSTQGPCALNSAKQERLCLSQSVTCLLNRTWPLRPLAVWQERQDHSWTLLMCRCCHRSLFFGACSASHSRSAGVKQSR